MEYPHSSDPDSLILIDQNVTDYQTLTSPIPTLLISPHSNGIDQITQQLPQPRLTLHLVCHGSPGCLYLGNTSLNLDNIDQYQPQLAQWQVKTIIIYSCYVASGDAGSEFLNKLHKYTGANIKASSEAIGPNWQLDVTRGTVVAPLAFTKSTQKAYQGVLATFRVTNTEDSGNGSLRQAIEDANDNNGADEIEFDSSLAGETIELTSGQLEITDELVINGLGADELIIDAGGDSRVFLITDGNRNQIDVSITGLTITGGEVSNYGGGIFNRENLTITESTISGNSSEYGGGGIYNIETLKVTNSTILSNSSENNGGGIYNTGTLNITNNTISGNSSENNGGGINNTGTLDITNSTISGNSSEYGGGGISVFGVLNITNSTISGNSSENKGGGIDNIGTLNITNSTISGNSSENNGGGIDNIGTLNITNSTITLNTASFGSGINSGEYSYVTIGNTIISDNNNDDIYSKRDITSRGGNIIGNGNVLDNFDRSHDQIKITQPGLAPVADNGGETQTHALQSQSPGVNNGINSIVSEDVTTDQRGLPRKVGSRVDSGAVESNIISDISTVTLVSVNEVAIEGGSEGIYRLTRTGSTSEALKVSLDATLSRGLSESDFTLTEVSGSFPDYRVTIPSKESFVELTLTVEEDSSGTVTLNIVSEDSYQVGDNSEGIVTIVSREITVTNTNDDGPGSLREAINIANQALGNNIIEFDPSLAAETIELTSGQLRITDELVINGLGADELTIDAGGDSRVFLITDGNRNQIDVSITELTITGGEISISSSSGGGGIFNQENLTITNSTISGNTSNYGGGGIFNNGTLTINNSSILDNQTSISYRGGGIRNEGVLNINDSTISNNHEGGGIDNTEELNINNSIVSNNRDWGLHNLGRTFVDGGEDNRSGGHLTVINTTITDNQGYGIVNSGTLTVNTSTISDNSSRHSGGGIDNRNGFSSSSGMGNASYSAGTAIIRNSTISNNTAGKVGGGISNSSDLLNYTEYEVSVTSGEITVINSTISGNTAGEAGGGISNIGKLSLSNSTITLNESDDASGVGHNLGEIKIANTIISGNLDTDFNTLDGHSDSDGVESITSLGGNFIGNGDLGDAFDQPTDQTNVTNPGLNTLADNGGPSKTHLPEDNSPVVDAGNNDVVDNNLTTDQRGENRIANDTVDIGAVELGDAEDNDSGDNNDDSDQPFPSTEGDDTLSGTDNSDSLDGQGGNDIIRAYDGDDTLIGSSGNDTLVGGEGRDEFIFNSADEGRDRITDFVQDEDLLIISRNGFRSHLTGGILSESQFALINDVTSDTRFIYNPGNNELFFDSDGSGNNNNSVLLTVIDNVVGFNHTDINVV